MILAGVIIIVIAIFVIVTIVSSLSSSSSSKPSYTISKDDKTAMNTTITTFISKDGTFGLDWSKVDEHVDISALRSAMIVSTSTRQDIDAAYSSLVTTRTMAIAGLLQQRDNGHPSVLSPSSSMAKLDGDGLNVLSDALWLSKIETRSSDVHIHWNTAHATAGDDGKPVTKVTIDWTANWTRSMKTPDAYKNTTKSDWNVTSDKISMKSIEVTLQQADNGHQWQVISINDTNGHTDLNDHGFVLATAGDISYNQHGIITAHNVNKNQDNNDAS
jgi:hypothetical protein